MKISGKKMGNIKALKESLKKGGSSIGSFIKNVPAEGITVRFLTEPEEWFGFYEYWNDENRNFVPMAQGEVLPDGAKPSFRYLTQALDIANDRVIPLKIAKTAANSLILKYDKFGTMLDRNYELQKHGEGLDTTYDVTPDAPSKLNLAKYELIDLEKILVSSRASALGETDTQVSAPSVDDDELDDDDVSPPAVEAKRKLKEFVPTLVEDDDDEEEVVVVKKKKVVTAGRSTTTLLAYSEIFPKDADGDETVRSDYSEAELKQVSEQNPEWLVEIADALGFDAEDVDAMEIISAILDEQKDSDSEVPEVQKATEEGGEEKYDHATLTAMKLRDLKLMAEDMEIYEAEMSKEEIVQAIIEAVEE